MEGLCSWEIMELFSQLGLQAFYPLSIAWLFTGIKREIHCLPAVLLLGPTQLGLEASKQLLQFLQAPYLHILSVQKAALPWLILGGG